MRSLKEVVIKNLFTVGLIVLSLIAGTIIGYNSYYSMRYPVKFEDEVTVFAEKYGVDPALVMGVIMEESTFRPDAVSRSGAVGLMQLMPQTAQAVADSLAIELSDGDLTRPAVNIELGVCYLARLTEKFGTEETALAAYNAGEGTVAKWLRDLRYSPDGKTLSEIPYPETAAYVDKVERSAQVYRKYHKIT